jgi:hypothetical protein
MSDYEASGVDCTFVIGDKDELEPLLRNTNLFGKGFTARGKLGKERLTGFLETLEEKYKVEIQVFCVRGVR